MRLLPLLAALATSLPSVSSAAYQGFNYASTFTNQSPKQQSDFQAEFTTAQNLNGAPAGGFHSARLFTMIQAGTTNTPISAIPAAIATNTTLLLGLWASAGDAAFSNEITALNNAISTYGQPFISLIAGISVGSEDLYRITPTAIQNKENVGVGPDVLTRYIAQTRTVLTNNKLSVPVGHVDTWTAWVNASNYDVTRACDFIGLDAYPYFEYQTDNSIQNGNTSFFRAYNWTVGNVTAAGSNATVWITETGWPVAGPTQGNAVVSVQNAKSYWDQVGCSVFGQINTWWYTMQDSGPTTPSPTFGIIGTELTTTPLYDISCPASTAPAV